MIPAPPTFHEGGTDWRARIAGLDTAIAERLAQRVTGAPLHAHAYAFHLNMRFGGMRPDDLLEFARINQLSGINIHVEDGNDGCLLSASDSVRRAFGQKAAALGLNLHIETSTTDPEGLAEAVRVAHATDANALRCYPRYEGRLSEIKARVISDLGHLDRLDPERLDSSRRLGFTLEQHEDLKSEELVEILRQVRNPRLSLLFDFGNMINAYETPLAALAIQAPYVSEVHVKDCHVIADRDGWAHTACASGYGHLPMRAMLTELLLLGADAPQVAAFALEEEEDYHAPAMRFPSEDPDPFIPWRDASFTDPGSEALGARLLRERERATSQIKTIRAMLAEIANFADLVQMESRVS